MKGSNSQQFGTQRHIVHDRSLAPALWKFMDSFGSPEFQLHTWNKSREKSHLPPTKILGVTSKKGSISKESRIVFQSQHFSGDILVFRGGIQIYTPQRWTVHSLNPWEVTTHSRPLGTEKNKLSQHQKSPKSQVDFASHGCNRNSPPRTYHIDMILYMHKPRTKKLITKIRLGFFWNLWSHLKPKEVWVS